MVMNFLKGVLLDFLDVVIDLVNSIFGRFDITKFTNYFNYIVEMANKANVIFPVKETIDVLKILCTFAFYSLVFWGIQKLYEMIRG